MTPHDRVWLVPLWKNAEKEGYGLLSTEEKAFLSTLRHPARRLEWICGRILLKRMIEEDSPAPCSWEDFGQKILPTVRKRFSAWTVRTRNSRNQGIPPRIFVENQPHPTHFSLSHTAGHLAAVSFQEDFPVGCDLCSPESFSQTMQRLFLHSEERKLLSLHTSKIPAEIFWGGKEAAYKAYSLRHSEAFHPLHWQIRLSACQWSAIHHSGRAFSLEIRQKSSFFLILAREG
ncbi:MAG: 4'-phosphopantetheinyl transferase superfamily protein [Planctomycetia bacterium]|nr:4'-phosphopantetheinyl transferase superfamily protein [Planctomycetia bacterium]